MQVGSLIKEQEDHFQEQLTFQAVLTFSVESLIRTPIDITSTP